MRGGNDAILGEEGLFVPAVETKEIQSYIPDKQWSSFLSLHARTMQANYLAATTLAHVTCWRTCRAGRRCELCEGWKGGLQPYNARSEGDDGEAQLRDYMLVCGSCQKVIDVEAQGYKPRELNFLKVNRPAK